jgi:nucleotide-binding universal stress UspA family protein
MRYSMFQNILVPINPLEDQNLLVKAAFNLGIKHDSSVIFVYFGEEEEAIIKLEKYIDKCKENGLKASYKSIKFMGDKEEIPDKIAKIADQFDLVIMGHLKFDKIYRFVHQSTASDLINLVSIPVMVIPDNGECKLII